MYRYIYTGLGTPQELHFITQYVSCRELTSDLYNVSIHYIVSTLSLHCFYLKEMAVTKEAKKVTRSVFSVHTNEL